MTQYYIAKRSVLAGLTKPVNQKLWITNLEIKRDRHGNIIVERCNWDFGFESALIFPEAIVQSIANMFIHAFPVHEDDFLIERIIEC